MSRKRAVVWDMDGVVVDSADAHNRSWVEMARRFDVPYDPDKDFKAIFGRRNSEIITDLWNVTDEEEIERMIDAKETVFRDEAASLPALPGVADLMRSMQDAGWKQAIGSSAPLQNIEIILEATGLRQYIEAITSDDDVTEGKPDPRVFVLSFERLGVEPSSGVVIEDAPAGVEAAKRAGAACLAVTNTQAKETLEEAGADLIVDSLVEVDAERLDRLVR